MVSFIFKAVYRFYQYQRSKSMINMGGIPRYVAMGGHSLFYWEFPGNSEQPILFLHGLLDEGFSNRRIIKELLDDGKRMIVFDLPGSGKSKLPRIKYLFQIDVWADLLLEAFIKLGLENILLVGHSMGGLISQHIVLKDSDKLVRKLVLLAPGGLPHPEREKMKELLFPKSEKSVLSLLLHLYGENGPKPHYILRKTLVAVWNGWENQYLKENTLRRENEIFHGDKVKEIRMPVLIIAGKNDEITTPVMMRKMKSFIKGSKLVWIAGAKHAIHLEKPKEIACYIKLFWNT